MRPASSRPAPWAAKCARSAESSRERARTADTPLTGSWRIALAEQHGYAPATQPYTVPAGPVRNVEVEIRREKELQEQLRAGLQPGVTDAGIRRGHGRDLLHDLGRAGVVPAGLRPDGVIVATPNALQVPKRVPVSVAPPAPSRYCLPPAPAKRAG